MKQITEDYVSFEIAKLLKEKGFDELCNYEWWITDIDKGYVLQGNGQIKNSNLLDEAYTAPTHQMALKWLREVHNQIIIIKYGNVGFVEESILQWWWELLNTKGELHACNIVDGNKSYEEACEDSILYVLKNLI
jgi:hypothetical protein